MGYIDKPIRFTAGDALKLNIAPTSYATTTNLCTWDDGGTVNVGYTNTKKEEKTRMRGIFTTYIVDPKQEKVLAKVQTIGENAQEAERKALMSPEVAALKIIDISKVDIYTDDTTDLFIRPKKDVQKVKIAKEDED